MDTISGVIGSVPKLVAKKDDDFSDRLSNQYTTLILIVFSLVVSAQNFVGDPISCWVPAHFTDNHQKYSNDYCWVKNTYYLPYEDEIPEEHEHHKRKVLPYYQWVPIILQFMALLFYLPCLVWRSFNNRSGIDMSNLVKSGKEFTDMEKAANREDVLKKMVKQMQRFLWSQKDYRIGTTVGIQQLFTKLSCQACGRKKGNYIVALYLFVKCLYIINVIGQFFLLQYFLGDPFFSFGVKLLNDLRQGNDWTETSRFPRVTMCDFKIRRLGNVHRYTVQCVLPVNLFNEKIFLFIWFWMLLVLLITVYTFLNFIVRNIIFSRDNVTFVKKHLSFQGKYDRTKQKEKLNDFVYNYLRKDGVFILRMIGHNTNALTTTDFVCALWDDHINSDGQTDPEKIKDSKDV